MAAGVPFSVAISSPEGVRRARTRLVDVEGVIARQAGALDWAYVDAQLRPLAAIKEAPEILSELAERRAEVER